MIAGGEKGNVLPDYIANIEGSPEGKWIKVSVERDGTFAVTNTRKNFTKTYTAPGLSIPVQLHALDGVFAERKAHDAAGLSHGGLG